jgi:deoxyribodipyrimidine photolyase
MLARRAIMWFRQDLRLHDNEALQEALGAAQEVIPVYVFDERIFMGVLLTALKRRVNTAPNSLLKV